MSHIEDNIEESERLIFEKFNNFSCGENHFKEEYINAQTELFSFSNEFYENKPISDGKYDAEKEIDFLECVVHYECKIVPNRHTQILKKCNIPLT